MDRREQQHQHFLGINQLKKLRLEELQSFRGTTGEQREFHRKNIKALDRDIEEKREKLF